MSTKHSSQSEKPRYINTLDDSSRARYTSKLQLIDGIDPYEVEKKDWLSDPSSLPGVTYPDIANYLVHSQSAYTYDDMKAYKSMESYNYFVCGWVKDVLHLVKNDRILVSAKVRHSQRMSESPLQPWIIAKKDGAINAGHCNCMAGLGEACSHIGALLFYIDAAVKIRSSKTVTQEPAYWLMPTGINKVEYDMVKDINFQSAKTMKRKLDDELTSLTPKRHSSTNTNKLPLVSRPTDTEFSAFLENLHKTRTKPVLLSLMPKYADSYIPKCLEKSYPALLTELLDEQCFGMSKDELTQHCHEVFETLSVTKSQANNVELKTRQQAGSKEWHRFRIGRVTASRMKSVCATTVDKPSQSVIKSICYPSTCKFTSKATRWGCNHEKVALDAYCAKMKDTHENFQCEKSGLVINPDYPYMGASPDAIVMCDCCGIGTVEIKCPYCVRTNNLKETLDSKSCLEDVDGNLRLKHSHAYYYQVQTQMYLCAKEYCDFVVWTECDTHFERILPNDDFWKSESAKAEQFFKKAILLELVGKFFSKPSPSIASVCESTVPSNMSNSTSEPLEQVSANVHVQETCTEKQTPEPDLICVCQKPYDATYDRVIGCDNENCKYKWLHFKCLNLKRAPKGNWFCPVCRKLPAKK